MCKFIQHIAGVLKVIGVIFFTFSQKKFTIAKLVLLFENEYEQLVFMKNNLVTLSQTYVGLQILNTFTYTNKEAGYPIFACAVNDDIFIGYTYKSL